MKRKYKPGERVCVQGGSEEIRKAIIELFKNDGWNDNDIMVSLHHIGLYACGPLYTKITLDEFFSRSAPEWAVDIRKYMNGFCWADGATKYKRISDSDYKFDPFLIEEMETIYTFQKPECTNAANDTEVTHNEAEPYFSPKPDEWCEFFYPDKPNWRKGKYIGKNTVSETKVYAVIFEPCESNPTKSDFITYMIDNDLEFRPIQKTRKIDMSKFAGSDVLVTPNDSVGRCLHAKKIKEFDGWVPLFNEWNHCTGDKEPEWLEGFCYQVKEWDGQGYTIFSGETAEEWGKVCAIKITGIKEGWEFQE